MAAIRFFIPVLLLGLMACQGCKPNSRETSGTEDPTANTPQQTNKQQLAVPDFSEDSAYAFIAKQVAFGPRVMNSPGHEACRQWLVKTLNGYGAEVTEQNFEATSYTNMVLKGTNIIARYNPNASRRILLAAHWDTRHIADSPISKERRDQPILGADDGGSGVGVLLEIARTMQANPFQGLGIDILLLDAEDYGNPNSGGDTYALGAQYWAKNPHSRSFSYGILLDMVGAKGARFPVEGYSNQFAGQVVQGVWGMAKSMGYESYFPYEPAGGVTDDHYYINTIARIPMIDIINLPENSGNGSFGDHWHTHDDDMDIIDKQTLAAVGQVVTAVIYREADAMQNEIQ